MTLKFSFAIKQTMATSATVPAGLMDLLGGELKKGDILVDHLSHGGTTYYEVLDTNVVWEPKDPAHKLTRTKELPGIKIRELYPTLGPSREHFIVRRDGVNFDFDDQRL